MWYFFSPTEIVPLQNIPRMDTQLGFAYFKIQLYSFFDICQEDTSSCYRENCSTNFIATLFIIVISWKQSRCPSMDKENCGKFAQCDITFLFKNKIEEKLIALEEIISVETKIKKKHGIYSLVLSINR